MCSGLVTHPKRSLSLLSEEETGVSKKKSKKVDSPFLASICSIPFEVNESLFVKVHSSISEKYSHVLLGRFIYSITSHKMRKRKIVCCNPSQISEIQAANRTDIVLTQISPEVIESLKTASKVHFTVCLTEKKEFPCLELFQHSDFEKPINSILKGIVIRLNQTFLVSVGKVYLQLKVSEIESNETSEQNFYKCPDFARIVFHPEGPLVIYEKHLLNASFEFELFSKEDPLQQELLKKRIREQCPTFLLYEKQPFSLFISSSVSIKCVVSKIFSPNTEKDPQHAYPFLGQLLPDSTVTFKKEYFERVKKPEKVCMQGFPSHFSTLQEEIAYHFQGIEKKDSKAYFFHGSHGNGKTSFTKKLGGSLESVYVQHVHSPHFSSSFEKSKEEIKAFFNPHHPAAKNYCLILTIDGPFSFWNLFFEEFKKTTNCLLILLSSTEEIPEEIQLSSRIEDSLFFDFPSAEERKNLFSFSLQQDTSLFEENLNIEGVVKESEGLSRYHIISAVEMAKMRRGISNQKNQESLGVNVEDLTNACKKKKELNKKKALPVSYIM